MKLRYSKQFILYTGASTVAMIVDLIIFTVSVNVIFVKLDSSLAILFATIIARIVSSLINFILSKKAFNSNVSKRTGIPKYFVLKIVQLLLSAFFVILICRFSGVSKTFIKCVVDLILYIAFYKIQYIFIFKSNKKKNYDTST